MLPTYAIESLVSQLHTLALCIKSSYFTADGENHMLPFCFYHTMGQTVFSGSSLLQNQGVIFHFLMAIVAFV